MNRAVERLLDFFFFVVVVAILRTHSGVRSYISSATVASEDVGMPALYHKTSNNRELSVVV